MVKVVFILCVDAHGLGKFLYWDEMLHLWRRDGGIGICTGGEIPGSGVPGRDIGGWLSQRFIASDEGWTGAWG